MSATLMFAPIKEGKSLPDELKVILRDKHGLDSNGAEFAYADMDYLRGLSDSNIKGADALIKAIQKYDVVRVWLEY